MKDFELIYHLDDGSINPVLYCELDWDDNDKALSNARGSIFMVEYQAVSEALISPQNCTISDSC